MSWFILALSAAIVFAVVNLISRYVLSHELRDPILATTVSGIVTFVAFGLISGVAGSIVLPLEAIGWLLIGGLFYHLGMLLFYFAIKREEATRVVAATATGPIFVTILAALFLGESFSNEIYIGIFLVVFGAFLIAIRESIHRLRLKKSIFLAIGSAGLGSIQAIIIKFITAEESVWSVLFWIGAGSLIVALVLFVFHHPHIRKRARAGIKHLVATKLLVAVGFSLGVWALSLGPASLVATVSSTKLLFVFFGATILSTLHSRFIHEKVTKGILIQKVIATILIVAGLILLI